MAEKEPLPLATGTDAPPISPMRAAVRALFDENPPGDYYGVLRVGYRGLDDNDLTLAKACAEHVIARAPGGSGDMMRALLLRAHVYEKTGNQHRHDELINMVVERRF